MKRFGLIGYPLSHSFSQGYFADKFHALGLVDHVYQNFAIERVQDFPEVISAHEDLIGMNVTIPYKEQICDYLDFLSPDAEAIRAVNTIRVRNHVLEGFNTDWIGFSESMRPLLSFWETLPSALILGSGGAAKAVGYALGTLGIDFRYVSRHPRENWLAYDEVTEQLVAESLLIIQATPLGMAPFVKQAPNLPFRAIGPRHLLFDLIYNPPKTVFLAKGEECGAQIENGLDMLHFQAEASWKLWQE